MILLSSAWICAYIPGTVIGILSAISYYSEWLIYNHYSQPTFSRECTSGWAVEYLHSEFRAACI